jgi:hypothetical protein
VKLTLQKTRVLAGLCPNCGSEAAPYRLCSKCRGLASLTRMLTRWEKLGAVVRSKDGRVNKWLAAPGMTEKLEGERNRKYPLWEGTDDKRTQPRLAGVRVDVAETIVSLIRDMGHPMTIEEIQAAWGRLRDSRKHGSLAGDILAIVAAQRRRERRAAKLTELRP